MTLEDVYGQQTTAEASVSAGEALEELLGSAISQGCLTAGVYESAKVMNVDPDSVAFCVLVTDEEYECDIALQIHFTLIQSFCFDNDIDIVRVNDLQRLTEIVGKGKDFEETEDLHCLLITLWDMSSPCHTAQTQFQNHQAQNSQTPQFSTTPPRQASSPSSQLWLFEWWWLGPFIAHPEAFQVINHLVLIALLGGAEDSSSQAVGSRQPLAATPGPNQAVEDSISHGALRVVGESPSAREAATKCPGRGIGLPMAPPEHK
ncbi:GA45G protein, partial [Polypterus senegalus]